MKMISQDSIIVSVKREIEVFLIQVTFAEVSQKSPGPPAIHYTVIWYPQKMVQMDFCDLSHTFHKQVTNVSQHVFCYTTLCNLFFLIFFLKLDSLVIFTFYMFFQICIYIYIYNG